MRIVDGIPVWGDPVGPRGTLNPPSGHLPFTQYLRPNGRRQQVHIRRPPDIVRMGMSLIDAGYRFEAEVLSTGRVSLTIAKGDEDVASELSENGPEIPDRVDKLITDFYAVLHAPR